MVAQGGRTGIRTTNSLKKFVIIQWNFQAGFVLVSTNLIFNLIFPNKTTSVAQDFPPNQPYYLIFALLMRY
jgi:hypothetical protein